MQGSEPSTLIVPTTIESSSHAWSDGAAIPLLGLVGVCLVAYLVFVHRRRRRVDPRELAFRKMSHKLGLSRRQINAIRQRAIMMGLSSPIGILVSEDLTLTAIEDAAR